MRAQSKRLFLIFLAITLALVGLSVLAVFLYRPTTTPTTPDWVPGGQSDAPSLAAGRRDATYNLLLVGRDRASAATDVMMLISYDVANGRASLIQFPRDTLVRMDGHKAKLNAVFAAAKRDAKKHGVSDADADMAAVRSLGDFLGNSLCVAVDYHVLVYLDGFVNLVDTIGGVTVDVPFAMHYDDPSQNLHIHLEAGSQHLDGAAAEQFVRFRKGNGGSGYTMGDLGRLGAQKQFAAAVLRQFKGSVSVTQVPAIMRTALSYVKSDLCLSDCVYFGRNALSVSPETVSLLTLPGHVVGNDYVMNRSGALAVLSDRFNVYDVAIPERSFDRDEVFNVPSDRAINARYRGQSPDLAIFDADSLGQVDEKLYLF